MTARALVVLGTGSHVGKSVLVTALCRVFSRAGYRVRPFKAQNMALNSFVTPDGGEVGMAQAVQAEACGVPPSVEMNPILLKPSSDKECQVVLRGRPIGHIEARTYWGRKRELFPAVAEALARLRAEADLVVVEGAGSPVEVNLKEWDITNLRVAELADAPVLLVSDIERGGVFAWLLGTLDLMNPSERSRVRGIIINNFRGDPDLLKPGLEFLEERAGVPVLGVIPHIPNLRVAQEDSVGLPRNASPGPPEPGALAIRVVALPHIANFTDFDPLAQEPGVDLRYVRRPEELGGADLVIVPGSKSTVADLEALRASGVAEALVRHARAGGRLIGICGGFQMLGEGVEDPDGVESPCSEAVGLGLLPVQSRFFGEKETHQVEARGAGVLPGDERWTLRGYEIHMGHTRRSPQCRPAFLIQRRGARAASLEDGAVSADGRIWGTYIHGLFDNDPFRWALLDALRSERGIPTPAGERIAFERGGAYDRLADRVGESLDLARIAALVGLPLGQQGRPPP
ncbi:MAG: cobyric acid synthase [Nitrospinota bacterium]